MLKVTQLSWSHNIWQSQSHVPKCTSICQCCYHIQSQIYSFTRSFDSLLSYPFKSYVAHNLVLGSSLSSFVEDLFLGSIFSQALLMIIFFCAETELFSSKWFTVFPNFSFSFSLSLSFSHTHANTHTRKQSHAHTPRLPSHPHHSLFPSSTKEQQEVMKLEMKKVFRDQKTSFIEKWFELDRTNQRTDGNWANKSFEIWF